MNDVIRYHRRTSGARNAIEPVETLVRNHCYHDGHQDDSRLLFGSRLDNEGFPYVGDGSPNDPLLLGVSTPRLLEDYLKFGSFDNFGLFHIDATFKLCRLGFPTITCGFSDRHRKYHVAAIFIVSQRTTAAYQAVLDSLSGIVQRDFGRRLRVNAVMADAEDAQLNALSATEDFKGGTTLMCLFHVLYNVRKRIKHLARDLQYIVMKHIMDMHFSLSMMEFYQRRSQAIEDWNQHEALQGFTAYFQKQWLDGRYWQIFHTPQGYATTNNPCEVFNATIKREFEWRSFGVLQLIEKSCTLIEDVSSRLVNAKPVQDTPSDDVKRVAKYLMEERLVDVHETSQQHVVRVLHHPSPEGAANAVQDYSEAVKDLDSMQEQDIGDGNNQDATCQDSRLPQSVATGMECVLDRVERKKAIKLYNTMIRWSTKRSHQAGMPDIGWNVCTRDNLCECRHFVKFSTCAHILIARRSKNLSIPGDKIVQRQFVSRVVQHQARSMQRRSRSRPDGTTQPTRGRPSNNTGAMHIQYICN